MTRDTRGERWYRRLLRFYPQDFRDEFGREMTQLFRDRRRDESRWSLWRSLLADLIRTAPTEHVAMLRQDLRQAWRGLIRTPIVTVTAMLTLAIGVGASTAVFSVVHAVLLRPLPYAEPDTLVEFFESNLPAGVAAMRVSALNYLSWAEQSTSFEAIAAFGSTAATLTDGGDPEMLGGSFVTASLFRVLQVSPIVGRALQPADEEPTSARVVVLGEQVWRNRFGADYAIVGRSITLDGQRHEVVGVMPKSFREAGRTQAAGAAAGQIFLPMIIDRARENRGNHTLRVVGRLRHGVTIDQARNEMAAVSAALQREFPASNTNWSARIESLRHTTLEPQVHRSLLLVLGAVAMVLMIACANVANLMLAQGARRRTELALRTALGAGRSRLVRQLLTESCCLAAISGAAGIMVAAIAHPLLRTLLPSTLPRVDETQIDLNVLAFGLLISVASGVVFGVVPAVRASSLDPSQSLMQAGRATTDPSRTRLRQLLVAAQMAVATMLLVGAALLLQGFVRLQQVSLGFDANDVLTVRMSLPQTRYADAERTRLFYERLVTTLGGSGRLRAVAIGTSAPFAPGVRASIAMTDRHPPDAGPAANVEQAAEHIVSGEYFQVLSIPVLAGRSFNERDTPSSQGVAIVSRRFARVRWGNMPPLGQTVERGGRSYEVIGVVGDVRGSDTQGLYGGGPDREPRAAVYFASAQLPQRNMTVLVGSNGDPTVVVSALRETIRQLDPALPVQQVRPLRDWWTASVAPTRLTTMLAAIFAASALLLASVGIYGVVAFTVASRTREIGVRMAIGASRGRVMRLVVMDGMRYAGGGILTGLFGAQAAARLIAAFLFEIPARDPATFATVGVAVTVVALVSSTIPALRATRIDPTLAIRTE